MKQKKMTLTSEDVKIMFETRLPTLCQLALSCHNAHDFKQQLSLHLHLVGNASLSPAENNIRRLIEHDQHTILEASSEQTLTLRTITLLWNFLKGIPQDQTVSADFYLDVYKQFERLSAPYPDQPDRKLVLKWMKRWESGITPRMVAIRAATKQQIIDRLITRIETHHSDKSRYVFPPHASPQEKRAMVESWWNDHRFHLAMAARSLRELNRLMGDTMSEEMKTIYREAHAKGIPVFVTPYYLSLIDLSGQQFDDASLRSYVFYSRPLVETFGQIKAWEREDIIENGKPNAAGWLLPEGNNIHRRYPEVAILIPDTMGRACGGLCASCQRLYDFQSGRFNFDLENLKPKETWDHKLHRLMQYFREDKQLRDILITGGDALMSRNSSLNHILDAVYQMARHKHEDNLHRPDGGKYAEIQRIRLGTRLPVYLPMRIDDELITILRNFKKKAEKIGISQFFIQTHIQTPLEVTPELCQAVRKLHEAGWTVTNQLVYTVAASRRGHTARLRQVLNQIGVLCYYTFMVKGFEENHTVFTPNSRLMQERLEEKAIGRLHNRHDHLIAALIDGRKTPEKYIRTIERQQGVPFLATDRSVINLPGVGKSMTFGLAGILPDGRRILAFDHDHTRRHSPVISRMPVVYIQENKSVADYLRQIAAMGENPAEYESIWQYTDGQTEPRFALYEYPPTPYTITKEYSNLG
ncbi:MAG: KamA family protein [Prevotella sp.]|nr:KamA family protein [Prevotella sp.]